MTHPSATFSLALITVVALVSAPLRVADASPVAPAWAVVDERRVEVEDQEIASLSPDGRWLAGVGPDSTFCLWEVATLTPTCQDEPLPIPRQWPLPTMTWAPDSSAVAFDLDTLRGFYDSDLYVYDVAAAALTNLTDDGYEGSVLQAEPGVVSDILPTWSPDGSQLAFVRAGLGSDQATRIMSIDRHGGEPTVVHTVDREPTFTVWTPIHWLADDTILYSRGLPADHPNNALYRIAASGGQPSLVAATGADDPIPGAAVAAVAGSTISIFSLTLRNEYSTTDLQPVYWLGDVAGGLSPIPAYDFGAGVPLPDPSIDDLVDAGVGIPAAPAATAPDGTSALVAYRTIDGFRLAVTHIASGAVTPLKLATPLDMVTSVHWVDGGVLVRTTPAAGIVLTLA